MGVSVCFVPLRHNQLPARQGLEKALGPLPDFDGRDETISFTLDGLAVILGLMPVPLPDIEDLCRNSRLWPDAAQALNDHPAHVVVTACGDAAIERACVLTRATAAVLACGGLAAYWYDANLVVPPELFQSMAATVMEEPPLTLWVDFCVARDGEGSAGFTRGLGGFGHRELEAPECPEPAEELYERFYGLALYLLCNGPVIKDGDTLGDSETEQIQCVHAESAYGNPSQVMRLVYRT